MENKKYKLPCSSNLRGLGAVPPGLSQSGSLVTPQAPAPLLVPPFSLLCLYSALLSQLAFLNSLVSSDIALFEA